MDENLRKEVDQESKINELREKLAMRLFFRHYAELCEKRKKAIDKLIATDSNQQIQPVKQD